jgi:large conductance mechanosensitive channel
MIETESRSGKRKGGEVMSMKIIQEFKQFAVKGNVVDLAVGIIIGTAFSRIVSSFVNDMLMPPIGIVLGGVDFSDLAVTLKEASGDIPAVSLGYGNFIQSLVNFIIISFAIFIAVRTINALKRKESAKPAEPPKPTVQEQLLMEIRDLLSREA